MSSYGNSHKCLWANRHLHALLVCPRQHTSDFAIIRDLAIIRISFNSRHLILLHLCLAHGGLINYSYGPPCTRPPWARSWRATWWRRIWISSKSSCPSKMYNLCSQHFVQQKKYNIWKFRGLHTIRALCLLVAVGHASSTGSTITRVPIIFVYNKADGNQIRTMTENWIDLFPVKYGTEMSLVSSGL